MKLFLPSPRAIGILLALAVGCIGFALYLRYFAIEKSAVALACDAGLDAWQCSARKIATALFQNDVFGWGAVAIATLNLLRPSIALFAAALALCGFGVVLYNAGLAALGASVLVLSLARRAPAPE